MSRKTTPSYVLLNQITLAAASSIVTFSNIPQGYSDLCVRTSFGASGSLNTFYLGFNGDIGNTNYFTIYMGGTGSSTGTSVYSGLYELPVGAYNGVSAGIENVCEIEVFDYSAVDKHKTVLSRFSSTTSGSEATANRWASTSAVTSLRMYVGVGNSATPTASFTQGSTFSLYGLVA